MNKAEKGSEGEGALMLLTGAMTQPTSGGECSEFDLLPLPGDVVAGLFDGPGCLALRVEGGVGVVEMEEAHLYHHRGWPGVDVSPAAGRILSAKVNGGRQPTAWANQASVQES